MCGRFTVKATWAELVALYRLTMDTPPHNLRPRYNVCADCVKWECPATPGILVLQLNIAVTTSRNAPQRLRCQPGPQPPATFAMLLACSAFCEIAWPIAGAAEAPPMPNTPMPTAMIAVIAR
jgi:hypothetical protein